MKAGTLLLDMNDVTQFSAPDTSDLHSPLSTSLHRACLKCVHAPQDESSKSVHLAYGVDILDIHLSSKDQADLVFTLASCSFYDNLLETWKFTVHN